MHTQSRIFPILLIFFSAAFGGGSLLLLLVFLYVGSFGWVDLELKTSSLLIWDAGLCLIFSLQHSGMIRQSFRKRLLTIFIPAPYHKACFSIVSGVTVTGLILFWQKSPLTVWHFTGYGYPLTRFLFLMSILGFLWGGLTLRSFDALGIKPVLGGVFDEKRSAMHLVIRGPYRWTRHPLYFFTLVMMWSCPHLTADRLLFNLFLTAWIVFGAAMEERDLVAEFGDAYRAYQQKVPMLIPWRFPIKIIP